MGFLRFILALAVVLNHVGGFFRYQITGGVVAVQLFFVISGFYMAMVLSEKYHPVADKKEFWVNRGMRIYVTYFSALVLVLILEGLAYWVAQRGLFRQWETYGDYLTDTQKILMGLSVLTILGQDAWLYLRMGISDVLLNIQGPPDTRLVYMLPMPQAWSVALELVFYALAPFLIRLSTRKLVAVAVAAFVIRFIAGIMGYSVDPWTYRFFPFELTLFLMGMISYRLSGFLKGIVTTPRLLGALLIALCFAAQPLVVWARSHGVDDIIPRFFIYIVAVFTLPALFFVTKKNKLDNFLAEFSYPIYLVHFSVIHLVDAVLQKQLMFNQSLRVVLVVFLTLAMSYLLIVAVERPVDRFRKKRTKLVPSNNFAMA